MRILITGGTGFIGSLLQQVLSEAGHELLVLTRQTLSPERDGSTTFLQSLDELPDTANVDAIVNLAGASLADKRWSTGYKKTIVDSRIETTASVVALCRRLQVKPSVLVSGSAIGYYGAQGAEKLDESAGQGEGFSAQLCGDWEHEASAVEAMGIRLCLMRLGVVLDSDGGAFVEMVKPFRLGVANWIGSGDQYLSWIHRRDAVGAIVFMLEHGDVHGVLNVTAPHPVTSKEFCRALKRHLHTWLTVPMPAGVMRLLVGEMADELLVQGQRVLPLNLQNAGYAFQHPDLDSALATLV
ncbi:MAG: TIGR01777 family oxidoreductase [Halioglobus sp.]